MSFITALLKNDLEKIGREAEPAITNTIIDIMNEGKNNKKIVDNIINKFIETIKTKIKDDKQLKIKILSIMKDIINKKDTTGKDTIFTNVYKENISLKNEIDKLNEEINKLKSPLVVDNARPVTTQLGGGLTDNIAALSDAAESTKNLTNNISNVTDAANDMKKLDGTLNSVADMNNLGGTLGQVADMKNMADSLKNLDVTQIPLLGIVLNVIISLSQEKIREDICSRLHKHKDKIVESAIRVFVKEITENNYINDIEIGEIYDSILNNIKKMEKKNDTKTIGGRKKTHKKNSKKSHKSKKIQKTNRKSRAKRL